MERDALQNNRQISAGSLLSFLQIGINILIGLLYTPLMIRMLGKSEYGLYSTVASTVAMLSVLNLGLGSGYIRYYSQYKASAEKEKIMQLNGLFLIVFVIIGIIALACGTFLTFNLDLVYDNGLSSAELSKAQILMALLTLNLSISFPMSVFYNIISANERFVFLKSLGMIKNIFTPVLTILVLSQGYDSIAMVLVTLFVSLIVDLVVIYYALHNLKSRFSFRNFDRTVFKGLFLYTVFIAINLIVDQVNWNLDKVLLGRFQGTVCVAVYAVGALLLTYYQTLSCTLSGIFTPYIHNTVSDTTLSDGEKDGLLTRLFIQIGRIQFFLLILVMTGFIFFGKDFVILWAGREYEESFYVALLLICPVTIPLIQNIGIEIQRAKNKHQFRSLLYLGMVFVNLTLTVILCRKYGAVGAAAGTAVSVVLANIIVMNVYYHKRCGIDIPAFWKSILQASAGLIFPCMAGVCINRFADTSKPMSLLLAIAVYSIIYIISVWLFSLNNAEKKWIRSFLRGKRGKRGIIGE